MISSIAKMLSSAAIVLTVPFILSMMSEHSGSSYLAQTLSHNVYRGDSCPEGHGMHSEGGSAQSID